MDFLFVGILFVAFLAYSWRSAMRKAMAASGADSSIGEDYVDSKEYESAEELQSSDYFTYENMSPQQENKVKQEKPVVAQVQQPEYAAPEFDLKQAVIYQTILCNDYNGEIK